MKYMAFLFIVLSCSCCVGAESMQRTGGESAGTPLGVLAAMRERHADGKERDDYRVNVGLARFLRAYEALLQKAFRVGFHRPNYIAVWGPTVDFQAWFPPCQDPLQVSYHEVREAIAEFSSNLDIAESQLADVGCLAGDISIDLSPLWLDINANGRRDAGEGVAKLFLGHEESTDPLVSTKAETVKVSFADVLAMRAECQRLRGIANCVLAFDFRELFERTGHLLFPRVVSKYSFLRDEMEGRLGGDAGAQAIVTESSDDVVDSLVFLHRCHVKVVNRGRLHLARQCFLESLRLCELSLDDALKRVSAERKLPEDDVSIRTIEWLREAQCVLDGRKMVRFWRGVHPVGIDILLVINSISEFDLIDWCQGVGAVEYLKEGGSISDVQGMTLSSALLLGDLPCMGLFARMR